MGELIENQLTGVTKTGNQSSILTPVKTKRGVRWGGVRYASYGFVALGGEGWRNCEGTRLSLMWPGG